MIKDYLFMEFEAKYPTEKKLASSLFKPIYAETPQQQNLTDCGLYLLQYVESFITVWTLSLFYSSTCIVIQDRNYCQEFINEKSQKLTERRLKNLTNWFEEAVILKKRKVVSDKIVFLAHQYHNGERISIPILQFENETSNFEQQNMNEKSNVHQVSIPSKFHRQVETAMIINDDKTKIEANNKRCTKIRSVPSILKQKFKRVSAENIEDPTEKKQKNLF